MGFISFLNLLFVSLVVTVKVAQERDEKHLSSEYTVKDPFLKKFLFHSLRKTVSSPELNNDIAQLGK